MSTRDMAPVDGFNTDPVCHVALVALGGGERAFNTAVATDHVKLTSRIAELEHKCMHYAKSALNGFDTLDLDDAVENAKHDLRALIKFLTPAE